MHLHAEARLRIATEVAEHQIASGIVPGVVVSEQAKDRVLVIGVALAGGYAHPLRAIIEFQHKVDVSVLILGEVIVAVRIIRQEAVEALLHARGVEVHAAVGEVSVGDNVRRQAEIILLTAAQQTHVDRAGNPVAVDADIVGNIHPAPCAIHAHPEDRRAAVSGALCRAGCGCGDGMVGTAAEVRADVHLHRDSRVLIVRRLAEEQVLCRVALAAVCTAAELIGRVAIGRIGAGQALPRHAVFVGLYIQRIPQIPAGKIITVLLRVGGFDRRSIP